MGKRPPEATLPMRCARYYAHLVGSRAHMSHLHHAEMTASRERLLRIPSRTGRCHCRPSRQTRARWAAPGAAPSSCREPSWSKSCRWGLNPRLSGKAGRSADLPPCGPGGSIPHVAYCMYVMPRAQLASPSTVSKKDAFHQLGSPAFCKPPRKPDSQMAATLPRWSAKATTASQSLRSPASNEPSPGSYRSKQTMSVCASDG